MTRYLPHSLLLLILLSLLAPVASAQSIDIRLSDGSRWRGQVSDHVEVRFMQRGTEITVVGDIIQEGDLFILVEGSNSGGRQWAIVKSDIRAIRTLTDTEAPAETGRTKAQPGRSSESAPSASQAEDGPGVFVLPLSGMVGPRIHHELIEKMVAEADKYGPGQIIILELTTGGGAVVEMEQIARTILEAKKKKRFVAWVHEAISAGCATASLCNEIYFSTMGTAGSMTAFAGGSSWQGQELERWLQTAGDWMEAGGRSRLIARAMIHSPLMLSYDKDPDTGEVTFYDNLSGEFILSRKGDNLTFNSTNAVHCGFADGVADTTEELAKLLDMPRWREISDFGRRLHDDWNALVDRAEVEVPRIFTRLNRGTAGDATENLNYQIRLIREIIGWWDRAPMAMRFIDSSGGSKEAWERYLRELLHRQARR